MSKGHLFVVSAPSGCGKGTILAEVLKNDRYYYSVSSTTRTPREGEVDGVNYNFRTKEQFEELIASDKMLEYAQFCGNYYGTEREMVEKKLSEGMNVFLEIEVLGAMQIKERCPDAVLIFIMPPSVSELERRLKKRGTEEDDVIAKRVAEAAREIEIARKYDYVVVNGELEKAIEDFKAVIIAEEHKAENAKEFIDEVLKNA